MTRIKGRCIRPTIVSIIALLGLVVLSSADSPSVGAQGSSARPALGPLAVRPAVVRVGGTLTISGRVQGMVQFLPPFVLVQSVATRVVNAGRGLCGGKHPSPLASFIAPGGGSGGPHTRKNPPVGTRWSVRFKIPAVMAGPVVEGKSSTVRTPPGAYHVAAVGVGLDYCTIPAHSDQAFSVGRFRIR